MTNFRVEYYGPPRDENKIPPRLSCTCLQCGLTDYIKMVTNRIHANITSENGKISEYRANVKIAFVID